MRFSLPCLLAATILTATGCEARDTPRVVLYVSADEYIARQVAALFEDQTGIRVDLVPDTEAQKTTGLVERLRAEADNPQADVFWSSEVFMTIGLADDGVLAELRTPATEAWPDAWRDPGLRWFGFAARARVIVFAEGLVSPAEAPAAWMDLADPRWAGRIVMADPRFGTTGGHLGAMKAWWDRRGEPEAYRAFLEGLAANRVRLLPGGNAGVVRAVATGEASVGMTDTDDVWAARAQGEAVDWVYARHAPEDVGGGGTLLIPNTVGLVEGGPHPEAGRRLVEFLLSEPVERFLAESVSGNVPLRPGLAEAHPQRLVPDPLSVDYGRAAAARAEAVRTAMEVLEGRLVQQEDPLPGPPPPAGEGNPVLPDRPAQAGEGDSGERDP